MLAEGKVDAITGFSFSMHYNLLQKGLKPQDIRTMLMADHGLVLYGNAIMVNPDFAKANPKLVAGFVRATIKGTLDTIKDPGRRHQIRDEAQRDRRSKRSSLIACTCRCATIS